MSPGAFLVWLLKAGVGKGFEHFSLCVFIIVNCSRTSVWQFIERGGNISQWHRAARERGSWVSQEGWITTPSLKIMNGIWNIQLCVDWGLRDHIWCCRKQQGWHLFHEVCGIVVSQRQWQPTPVLLPGKSHGRSSLVGCSPGVTRRRTILSDFTFTFMHWRRKWLPAPGVLPGESQRQSSLVGCCLWGHTESGTTDTT